MGKILKFCQETIHADDSRIHAKFHRSKAEMTKPEHSILDKKGLCSAPLPRPLSNLAKNFTGSLLPHHPSLYQV